MKLVTAEEETGVSGLKQMQDFNEITNMVSSSGSWAWRLTETSLWKGQKDTVVTELFFQRENWWAGKTWIKKINLNLKNEKQKQKNTWKRRHSKLYRYTIHC